MSKISVIIVNYNTKDVLDKCLANLIEVNEYHEIIVVDNASSDGSAEMVETQFPRVILIKTVNKGFAWGANLGLQKATGEHICYLGSDAFPKDGTLLGLSNFLDEHTDVGAVTPELLLESGEIDWDAHRNIPNPWNSLVRFANLDKVLPHSNIFNNYYLGGSDMTKPHEIKLCIAHFFMAKRTTFDKVGKWDEDFFLYGEDVDMCFRIVQSGLKIFYVPQFKCLHLKGYSVGVRATTRHMVKKPLAHRLKMRTLSINAMDLFVKKHYAQIYPPAFVKLMQLGMFLLGRLRYLIEFVS